jgi:transcriptional regulator GlxA family with amidase domain
MAARFGLKSRDTSETDKPASDGRGSDSMQRVAILALPGVQLLDVSGPLDVFAEANVQAARKIYELLVVGAEREVRSSSGVRVLVDQLIGQRGTPFDTVLVAGRPNAAEASTDRRTIAWLCREARAARRYGSVCTGAFVLAEAGLLSNRRVTTHWAVSDELARRFPSLRVDADAIHVRDGKVRTAAGVTAGLDLALALVQEDLGRDLAMRVAAQLVMFFRRPGGQLQFSRRGEAVPVGRSALQEVQRWVAAEPAAEHSVSCLAQRVGMSARHFSRLFRREVGMTPARWVELARVSAARTLLEQGHIAPKQVAGLCGFANADTLRRAFSRHLGVSPSQYRKLYRLDEQASGRWIS